MGLRRIEVVGAVIVRDGTILCAQRGHDSALSGVWEFPGGKVEPGETHREALVREIAEELRCSIVVGVEITTTTHEYDFAAVTLTTFRCELVAGSPTLTEHAEVRWLAPSDLAQLDWAAADVPTVEILRSEQ